MVELVDILLSAWRSGPRGRHYIENIPDRKAAYYPNQDGLGGNGHANRQGGQKLDPNTQELEILK